MHKKNQGKLGEALVLAQIIDNKCIPFIEFGDNSKVDIIIQDGLGALHKVQVKCFGRCKHSPDSVSLCFRKNGPNYRFKYTKGMFDWFALVDKQTNRIAWIDANAAFDMNMKSITLRLGTAKNGQKARIRQFADYEAFPFIGGAIPDEEDDDDCIC